MLKLEYWISEVAERVGVSVRTIRYYIDEGLLPQPEIRGKYAVFTDAYLHRLELIKLLKDAYMPLKEIKALLSEINDDQVFRYLNEHRARQDRQDDLHPRDERVKTIKPNIRESTAEEYIKTVLQSSPSRRLKRNQQIEDQLAPVWLFSQTPKPVTPESWQRVELQPGIELHLREPLTTRQRRLIEKITELIRLELRNQRED